MLLKHSGCPLGLVIWSASPCGVPRVVGGGCPVRLTAPPRGSFSSRCLLLDLGSEPWLLSFSFGYQLILPSIPLLPLPLPRGLGSIVWLPTCMNAVDLLLETVRTAISWLRSLASSLEAGLHHYEAVRASHQAGLDLESGPSRFSTPASCPVTPAPASLPVTPVTPDPSRLGWPSRSQASPASNSSSYHQVAESLVPAPAFCFDLCSSLSGSRESIKSRVERAWTAGLWAKATLEGKVSKPRPTPKLEIRSGVYIVVRSPGITHPVRVSTSAEYFRLVPRFTEDSISHSFPSQAEGQVYCAALGIPFPELLQR